MSTFDSIPNEAATGANVTVTNFPATQPVSSADGALTTVGSEADAAWVSGNGTLVALLKKIVAVLTGTLTTAVSGTVTVVFGAAQAVTQSGAPWRVNANSGDFADGAINTVGTQADAAWVSGNGTLVALLKKIVAVLTGTLTVSTSGTTTVSGTVTTQDGGGSQAGLGTCAASNNATNVKASAGRLYGVSVMNVNAAIRYLKLYDKATAPAPATDNALLIARIPIPVSNGAIVRVFPKGIPFSNGLGYAIVTGASDTDNTSPGAGDVVGLTIDFA